MKTIKILAVAAVALTGCGDNTKLPDAKPDATPSAPTLGAQIDRMGRPVVNTGLNHGFDPTAAGAAAKDTYNQDSNKQTWLANVPEFAKNLALIDLLDTGVCGNGICEAGETTGAGGNCMADCPTVDGAAGVNGCGNQAAYT